MKLRVMAADWTVVKGWGVGRENSPSDLSNMSYEAIKWRWEAAAGKTISSQNVKDDLDPIFRADKFKGICLELMVLDL